MLMKHANSCTCWPATFRSIVGQLVRDRVGEHVGRHVVEHVGVKAPGNANNTTRLPLKISSVLRSFQSNGFGPSRASLRTRVLKTTFGTLLVIVITFTIGETTPRQRLRGEYDLILALTKIV